MGNFLKMRTAALFLAVMCVGFTSCSDDNDEPGGGNDTPGVVNPSNVFTGEMPKSVAGTTINRNSEGLVTEMKMADGKTVTFEYLVKSRAAETQNTVIMKVIDGDVKTDYIMTIGANGFINKAHIKVDTGSPKESEEGDWKFEYDSDGHLTNGYYDYTDEQGHNTYSVTIKWKDGNIIKTYKDDGWDSYTHLYTSETYKTPLENKGALFMFESIYPVEIYYFECAYYAGMLGKGPKNLAVASYEYDEKDELSEYIWTLDKNGYPIKFKEKDDPVPEDDINTSVIKFTW